MTELTTPFTASESTATCFGEVIVQPLFSALKNDRLARNRAA